MRGIKEDRYNRFLHGLDNNRAGSHSAPLLSDAELMSKINYLTPKIKTNNTICAIIIVIAFILPFFLGLGDFSQIIGIVIMAIGAGFGVKARQYKKQLKNLVGNNIVRGVLADSFELENYSPGCHIRQNAIEHVKLIHQPWNQISGSDLVEGTYRGVKFTFSDLFLQHVTGSGKNRRVVTRFKGQWLIVELAKNVPFKIQLRARSGTGGAGNKAKSDVETENVEFNDKFWITTGDPHTAFYVLTPHFMEYILKAKSRSGAPASLNIDGRKIHIALHNGRDLFEPCSKKLYDTRNIEMLRNQMKWDINYITGIIDELLLNENLFATTVGDDGYRPAQGG